MARPVDVFITDAELAQGRKVKKTTCMKIDDSILLPVQCVSKPGISSGTLFVSPEQLHRGRFLTNREMAIMYDKFVGPGSLNNAALRLEVSEHDQQTKNSHEATKARITPIDSGDRTATPPSPHSAVVMAAAGLPPPQTPAAGTTAPTSPSTSVPQPQPTSSLQSAPSLQSTPSAPSPAPQPQTDGTSGAREARPSSANLTMKYVEPKIAKKYGIQQSITPNRSRASAPPMSLMPAVTAASRSSQASSMAVTDRSMVGGGMAASSAAEFSMRAAATVAAASKALYNGRPPRPPSASFCTTSREKAQQIGSHFVYGIPRDLPAPGKYTPKYGAMDKDSHTPTISKTGSGLVAVGSDGASIAAAAIWVAAAAGGRHSSSVTRPTSAPASGRASVGVTNDQPPNSMQAAAAAHSGPRSISSTRPGSGGRRGRTAQAAAHYAEARNQLRQRHEELFSAAHRVHARPPPGPPASQSFKSTSRGPLFGTPTANSLFGEYYKDGFDSLTRRCTRPASAFQSQTDRKGLLNGQGETGSWLGPGAYGPAPPPATTTGRHVPAGHVPLPTTPDFSRTTPRPQSAPPVRPPPASAIKHGYYGPDAPTTSLFPDEPDFNELVSVRNLQEHTTQRPLGQGGLPGRASATPTRPQSAATRPQSAATRPQSAATTTGAATGSTSGAVASEGGQPFVYFGPERFGDLTSAGLAKRVPGGAFGNATREESCQAMRAISNPRVTPPAAVVVKPGTDLTYDYDIAIEAHRSRPPAWHLPPNRVALSQQWVLTAAQGYLA